MVMRIRLPQCFVIMLFLFARSALAEPDIPEAQIPEDASKTVQRLLRELYSGEPTVRRSAARKLGEIGRRAAVAVPFLVSMLDDDPDVVFDDEGELSDQVGDRVAETLGAIGKPAIDALVPLLKHENPTLRRRSVSALGGMECPERLEHLFAALTDKDEDVRAEAMWGLYGAPLDAVYDHIIAGLKDEAVRVRFGATSILRYHPDSRAVGPLLAVLKDENEDQQVRINAIQALGAVGDKRAVGPLMESCKAPQSDVRAVSAEALGRLREARAVDLLISMLDDESDAVCYYAASALGEIGDPKAIRPLLENGRASTYDALNKLSKKTVKPFREALKSKNSLARKLAATFVGIEGSSDDALLLLPLLHDEDVQVRMGAVRALGRLRNPRAVRPLVEVLEDPQPGLRMVAAEALNAFGDEQALEPLLRAAKDENLLVRMAAVSSLPAIDDPRVADAIIDALLDTHPKIRERAVVLLRLVDLPAKSRLWIACLKDAASGVRLAAAQELAAMGDDDGVPEALIEALQDDDPKVKSEAAKSLGKIGSAKAVDALIPMLEAWDHYEPRSAAAKALCRIGGPRAAKALRKVLERGHGPHELYAMDGPVALQAKEAIEVYEKTIRTASGEQVYYAVYALGELGDPRGVDALMEALDIVQGLRRDWVIRALGKINDPRCVEMLKEYQTEGNRREPLWATVGLYKLNYRRAEQMKRLAKALDDGNWEYPAILMLSRVQSPEATELLAKVMKDRKYQWRWFAADKLGKSGDRSAIKHLLEMANDKEIMFDVARSLHRLGYEKTRQLSVLIEGLRHDETFREAVQALEDIKDVHAIPDLIEMLPSLDRGKRGDVNGILEDITGRDFLGNVYAWRRWWQAKREKLLNDE